MSDIDFIFLTLYFLWTVCVLVMVGNKVDRIERMLNEMKGRDNARGIL